MIKFENVKIIKPGIFVKGADPKLQKLIDKKKENEEGIKELGSTVTLIKAKKNVLVDTGMYGEKEFLLKGLKKERLVPKDINILVLTHAHSDHFFYCSLFENAIVYWGGGFKETGKEHPIKMKFDEKLKLCEDVFLLNTPGILQYHASVLVKTDKGTVVVAGDAITFERDLDLKIKHPKTWNLEEYDKSRKKILEIADYIIPGHGDRLIKIK